MLCFLEDLDEELAENTGLPKKDVVFVLDKLGTAIEHYIKKRDKL